MGRLQPNPSVRRQVAVWIAVGELLKEGETLLASQLTELIPQIERSAKERTLRKMYDKLKKQKPNSQRKYLCCRPFATSSLRSKGRKKAWSTSCLVRENGEVKTVNRFVHQNQRPKSMKFKGKKVRVCTPEYEAELNQKTDNETPRSVNSHE